MKPTVILLVFSFALCLTLSAQQKYIPRTGDLLFQDLDCGEFCDAIEKVTTGVADKDFSHVGIVSVENNVAYIIEAGGRGVVKTPIDSFLVRSLTPDKKPKVFVGRVAERYNYTIPLAIVKSKMLLGKKYDEAFNIMNDAYYCSELVYFAFADSTGNSLFELAPMTFKDPDTQETFPAWTNYFKKLGMPIPEGEPGLNPGGISRSDKIEIVYRFF